jgi:hypothetical protein
MANRHHALLLIAWTVLAVPAISAEVSIDGTYTGERVLEEGTPGPCVPTEPVSLTIRGESLSFTNSRVKNYTISFAPHLDGSFAQLSADIGGEVVDIRGHVGDGVLDADVNSASCSHHWHVERRN